MHTGPVFTGPVPHVGGPILPPGAPTVLINFLPAATVTGMQREDRMEQITNKQLSKSGVPPVGVVENASLSPQTNGQLSFTKWKLDMNPTLMQSSSLTNAQTEQLGNTLYHESRHSEQWYLIARNEAAQGKTAADISASTGMPATVTKAAAAHPLDAKDPMHGCAQQMYNSVYGKGAASRNKTLTEMPKLNEAYTKAADANRTVLANPASTAVEKQAAYAKAQSAYEALPTDTISTGIFPKRRTLGIRGTPLESFLLIKSSLGAALFAATTLAVGCKAGLRVRPNPPHRGEPMLNIDRIAEALVDEQATVASVAHALGTLGEMRSSEVKVLTTEPEVQAASIGFPKGKDATATPDYVQLYFRPNDSVPLASALPSCTQWKQIPNTPGASPFLYSCRFVRSSPRVEVVFFADPTGEIGNAATHLHGLLLQRNVW